VKEVDAKGAVVTLDGDLEGYLKASELSRDKVEDARNVINVGDTLEVKIINVDRKNRQIGLSVKAKDVEEEKAAVRDLRKQETETMVPTTIGDLIKAQMEGRDK